MGGSRKRAALVKLYSRGTLLCKEKVQDVPLLHFLCISKHLHFLLRIEGLLHSFYSGKCCLEDIAAAYAFHIGFIILLISFCLVPVLVQLPIAPPFPSASVLSKSDYTSHAACLT